MSDILTNFRDALDNARAEQGSDERSYVDAVLAELVRTGRALDDSLTLSTQHDERGEPTVAYQPWIDNGAVGLRITHIPTGTVEFLYFNPSDNQAGEDVANVFVYHGPTGDPAHDSPAHHYLVLEGHFTEGT